MARIWIVNHYASTPEQPLTSAFDVAKALTSKGHEVTIFASSYNHYRFEETRLRNDEGSREEFVEGVRFWWIKTPPYRANDWRRVVNMVVFAVCVFNLGRAWDEKPDVVIGATVHPLAALSAYLISRSKQVPFIYEVRDLWPLVLIEFGRVSRYGPTAWALGSLERFLSRQAAAIVSPLQGAPEYFAKQGIPLEKVVWIPHPIELARYSQVEPADGRTSAKFTLMYVGGHVYGFALGAVLRAAEICQNTMRDSVRFVLVGGGQEKPRLIELANRMNLQNVEFRGIIPKSELYRVMGEADAFILPMRDRPGLYKYGSSFNKLCDYLAAGRPVIFAGNPSYNPVVEARAGIVVKPEDPAALVQGIRHLMSLSADERLQMATHGQTYVRQRHEAGKIGEQWEKVVRSALASTSAVAHRERVTAS